MALKAKLAFGLLTHSNKILMILKQALYIPMQGFLLDNIFVMQYLDVFVFRTEYVLSLPKIIYPNEKTDISAAFVQLF